MQLKEAYEQMHSQPSSSGGQGISDESGTDNDSKVRIFFCSMCVVADYGATVSGQ